jgi:RHS repeat-associated protein
VAVAPGYYAVAINAGDSLGAVSATWAMTIAVAIGTTSTYGYDHLNRLTNATEKSQDFWVYSGSHPWYGFLGGSARTTSYTFDPVGNRLSQANTLPGAATPVTTSSTYDKADRILTAGVLSYTFDADGNVRSRTPSGGSATTYAYDQANRRTGATAGGAISSYGFDGDGNPLIMLSASVPNNVASQPLQYTAEPRDPETGLIYLRARMYDPSSGRLAEWDPRPLSSCDHNRPSTMHKYTYTENGPINRTDHDGKGGAGAFLNCNAGDYAVVKWGTSAATPFKTSIQLWFQTLSGRQTLLPNDDTVGAYLWPNGCWHEDSINISPNGEIASQELIIVAFRVYTAVPWVDAWIDYAYCGAQVQTVRRN